MADDYASDNDGDEQQQPLPAARRLKLDGDGDGDDGVAFVPDDATVAVPHPAMRVFVLPPRLRSAAALAQCRLVALPHPRHGAASVFLYAPPAAAAVGSDSPGSEVDAACCLFEVQEQHGASVAARGFGDAWFAGNAVEPSSPLFLATPFDAVFFALALARAAASDRPRDDSGGSGGAAALLLSADDVLARDGRFADPLRLPEPARAAVARGLRSVCACKVHDGVEYFRFDAERFAAWLKAKHARLAASAALRDLLGIGGEANASAKALALLLEYVEPALHAAAAAACGVEVSAATAAASSSSGRATHWRGGGGDDAATAATAAKKPKLEGPKSASVKRLERAGPVKGTPTLASLFARRAAPPPPPTAAAPPDAPSPQPAAAGGGATPSP